jgi:DTW domain-containing protein YfiP
MDMYNAFIQNPMGRQGSTQQILGVPDTLSVVAGTTDIFAPANSKAQQLEEVGYQNYIKNLTPAENMMAYENDPNIKECVVYDAATGAKQFAIMNMATGQPVPNTEPLNTEVFMPDTTIDLANKIARNRNLNRTFPLIVLNDNNDVMSKY